ncbi:MAG: YraN family protein [Clostridia bacterium]|nr:YraN family protein [Clostridia bacterium]
MKKKYKIIETNFVCKIGEIDIIAKDKDVLVFVEVKSRSTKKFGLPREAVTLQKQNKIRNVAQFYLQKTQNFNQKCRFDVIEILDNDINHIVNAF